MSAWIVSIVVGVLTGIGLYGLVRLRMFLGPIVGRKFGVWGRRTVWVLLISAMVVLAELDLVWLRDWLENSDPPGSSWYYEAVYASTLLAVGLALVCRRVLWRPSKRRDRRTAEQDEQAKSLRRTR